VRGSPSDGAVLELCRGDTGGACRVTRDEDQGPHGDPRTKLARDGRAVRRRATVRGPRTPRRHEGRSSPDANVFRIGTEDETRWRARTPGEDAATITGVLGRPRKPRKEGYRGAEVTRIVGGVGHDNRQARAAAREARALAQALEARDCEFRRLHSPQPARLCTRLAEL